MENIIPGTIIIKGKLGNIKAFLREQIKREDELGNLQRNGVEILCEKNGLIHYVLKAPSKYYIRDAYPLMISQTHIAAAANSNESVVEMVINVTQNSIADALHLRRLTEKYCIGISVSCRDCAADEFVYIELDGGKIIEYEKMACSVAA